jgi:outer membrane protein OmpA-like peptidoglycan-associated protein
MNRVLFATTIFLLVTTTTKGQQKTTNGATGVAADNTIPISNADLGTFPYFKTLPNFYPRNESDSVTIEQNRTYFFDGKAYFTIEGQVSAQILSVRDSKKKIPSEFQIIQEFDKIVSTLEGKKIYTGKLPVDQLKKISGNDIVELASKHQLAPNAHYGVVEYVIKTPQKELWVQLVPSSIVSGFYNILVVEKESLLLTTNINKQNLILKDLEKSAKAVTNLYFDLDNIGLLTESRDELLNIVGLFQAHPDWKIKIEINNAPVGKPDYILALTEKRAAAVKEELISLGVKPSSIDVKGLGDTKPLVSNDTEKGRQTNTRVEISKL